MRGGIWHAEDLQPISKRVFSHGEKNGRERAEGRRKWLCIGENRLRTV